MIQGFLPLIATAFLAGVIVAGDLKSGPQAGEKVPGPFHPLNVNGEDAGRKECLYCKHGDNPVVAVFARTADDANLHKLITALDGVTDKNQKVEMGGFVVYLSDEAGLHDQLKSQAEKAKYKQVILAIDSPAGPAKYNIAKDADITVLVYRDRVVVANHAFTKGRLDAPAVEKIVADIARIVK